MINKKPISRNQHDHRIEPWTETDMENYIGIEETFENTLGANIGAALRRYEVTDSSESGLTTNGSGLQERNLS